MVQLQPAPMVLSYLVLTATSFSGSGANLSSLPSQVTINNASGNRVITSDGGTTLNCEDTLRYDGTNFLIGTNTEAPYSNRNLTVALVVLVVRLLRLK